MLRLARVSAGYRKRPVLREIELTLEPGFHVILGPNGAGKTTLFRVCAGILPSLSGQVLLGGRDVFADEETKAGLGYVPHRDTLYPSLTVRQNLLFYARLYGLSVAAAQQRIEFLADHLGLGDLLPMRSGELSQGQKRRAMITRALVPDPHLLLLDEPTNALDPEIAKSLRAMLKDLARHGRVVLCSTHNLYEAAELAEEVILLKDGRVLHHGPVSEIRSQFNLSRRVGLRVLGDPREALAGVGCPPVLQDGFWVITVRSDAEVGNVVTALVSRGLKVIEVADRETPLESLYFASKSNG